MKEVFGGIAFGLIIAGVVLGVVFVFANLREQDDCARYSRVTGRETYHEWAWGPSCYVKTDKGTFLLGQVRSED